MPKDDFRDRVIAGLAGLGEIRCRAMFGGYGLYLRDTFFGIIYRGRLYLHTDGTTRGEYEAYGMRPFRPNPRQTLKSYYEIPAEVLNDLEQLVTWAGESIGTRA